MVGDDGDARFRVDAERGFFDCGELRVDGLQGEVGFLAEGFVLVLFVVERGEVNQHEVGVEFLEDGDGLRGFCDVLLLGRMNRTVRGGDADFLHDVFRMMHADHGHVGLLGLRVLGDEVVDGRADGDGPANGAGFEASRAPATV